jgi:hypothetical protein
MDMKKVQVNYLRSMMTLCIYATDVVRCENTFILRNQLIEDDVHRYNLNSLDMVRDKIFDSWLCAFAII